MFHFPPYKPNMPVHYDNIPLVWTQFLNSDVPLNALYTNSMILLARQPDEFNWPGSNDVPEFTWLLHMIARVAYAKDLPDGLVDHLFRPRLQQYNSAELIRMSDVPIVIMNKIGEHYKNGDFSHASEAFINSGWFTHLEEVVHSVFSTMHAMIVNSIAEERLKISCQTPLHQGEAACYCDKRNWHRTSDDGNWIHNNGLIYDEIENDNLLPWLDGDGNDLSNYECQCSAFSAETKVGDMHGV